MSASFASVAKRLMPAISPTSIAPPSASQPKIAAMNDHTAIVSVITSGVVTPSIIAWYALRAQCRQEKRTEHEHQVTRTEDALNNVVGQLRLLHTAFSMWTNRLPVTDPRFLENDRAIAEAIERAWLSANQLRIRFGEDSPVYLCYGDLLAAIDVIKAIYSRYDDDAPPSASDEDDWEDAVDRFVDEQKRFVRTVRLELRSP
jgi:hypothetical protein